MEKFQLTGVNLWEGKKVVCIVISPYLQYVPSISTGYTPETFETQKFFWLGGLIFKLGSGFLRWTSR